MWESRTQPVQVVAWRMLHKLKAGSWPVDLNRQHVYGNEKPKECGKSQTNDHVAEEDSVFIIKIVMRALLSSGRC